MIRDIMQAADLTLFPQIGLGLFLLAFVAILIRVKLMSGAAAHYASLLPLSDEHGPSEEVSDE